MSGHCRALWRKSSFFRSGLSRLCSPKTLCSRVVHDADTIFALSSGHGKCGVAIVRVSGPAAGFTLQTMAGFSQGLPAPRTAVLRNITDPCSQELLDRGLVLWFPGPRSFTGEDSAEFHIHGGPAVISGVLKALGCLPGVRAAAAGEFTRRAFLAGKLDLTEVEGLGDLIHAETEAQRRQALRQMAGDLARLYQDWSQHLIRCLAHLEAFIDFGEDELIENDVLNEVDRAVSQLQLQVERHLQDERRGERLRSGVQVVIAGAPNAGKSSLLNLLCKSHRPVAIVSPVAGTTRDVVESHVDIGGFPVVLSDTAGLRDAVNSVEREGVRRARERVELADVTLVVLDLTHLPKDHQSIPTFLTDHLRSMLLNGEEGHEDSLKRCLLVLNKRDLLHEEQLNTIEKTITHVEDFPPVCLLSCQSGDGFDHFLSILQNRLQTLCGDPLAGSPSLTQARHRSHLQQCLRVLAQYHQYRDLDLALAAEGLRLALTSLGRITGKVGPEEILDVIFRDFCIGK
ncbi:tRNA modification GTPase GTPBP3, mitochondrial [Arapaima gigas]